MADDELIDSRADQAEARQAGSIQRGTVVRFDAEVGLGTLSGTDGATYDFHCTALADGTRTIEVGRSVAFVTGPAGPGRWEARTVDPLD